jgi:hypothetical protein
VLAARIPEPTLRLSYAEQFEIGTGMWNI